MTDHNLEAQIANAQKQIFTYYDRAQHNPQNHTRGQHNEQHNPQNHTRGQHNEQPSTKNHTRGQYIPHGFGGAQQDWLRAQQKERASSLIHGLQDFFGGYLDKIDEESVMLGLIAWRLYKTNGDTSLILALLYVMFI